MSQNTIIAKMKLDRSGMSDKELIEELKNDLKEVRTQRNEYEQELIAARKKIRQLTTDNQYYESYINRTSHKYKDNDKRGDIESIP